jgi:hypothetical protein
VNPAKKDLDKSYSRSHVRDNNRLPEKKAKYNTWYTHTSQQNPLHNLKAT